MRIGYDAKRLFHNRRGLGNYSRSLVKALGKSYPEEEYFLYTPSAPQDEMSNDFRQMPFHIKTASGLFSWYWRTRGILNDFVRDKIEIYHGLSHELPLGIHNSSVKSVVTVHDTIAFKYPQYFSFIDRNIYQTKLSYAVQSADIVHCISNSTAADVINQFKIDEEKIRVIPPILDEHFLLEDKPVKPKALPEKYYLYVGALGQRKNLMNLLSAWHHSGTDAHLVYIGSGEMSHQLKGLAEDYNENYRFHIYSDVSYAELPAYYAHAEALVYISEYEGFGLPLMEAAAASCPVITSDVSSMPEVLGDTSIQVNPLNVDAIADAIKAFEEMSAEEVNDLKDRARNFIDRYRAEVVSKDVMEMYAPTSPEL